MTMLVPLPINQNHILGCPWQSLRFILLISHGSKKAHNLTFVALVHALNCKYRLKYSSISKQVQFGIVWYFTQYLIKSHQINHRLEKCIFCQQPQWTMPFDNYQCLLSCAGVFWGWQMPTQAEQWKPVVFSVASWWVILFLLLQQVKKKKKNIPPPHQMTWRTLTCI